LLGSATTLRACAELNRNCYGFEIKKDFYKLAKEQMINEDILNGIMADGQVTINSMI
jgi:site-specific DNA-methyltransferase (adenine-specific)